MPGVHGMYRNRSGIAFRASWVCFAPLLRSGNRQFHRKLTPRTTKPIHRWPDNVPRIPYSKMKILCLHLELSKIMCTYGTSSPSDIRWLLCCRDLTIQDSPVALVSLKVVEIVFRFPVSSSSSIGSVDREDEEDTILFFFDYCRGHRSMWSILTKRIEEHFR